MFVGADIGTQSLKVVVTDGALVPKGTARRTYAPSFPQPGWAEQDPSVWETALGPAIAEALAAAGTHPRDVRGLEICGQLDGCIAVNDAGRARGPCLLWMDRRATDETADVPHDLVRRKTGVMVDAGHMAAKVRWLKRHRLDGRHARFHQPVSYLVERLTGATNPARFNIVANSPKATVATTRGMAVTTNDAANPFALDVKIVGAAALADRSVILQTTDWNLLDGGNLLLQPQAGNVSIGGNLSLCSTNAAAARLDVSGSGLFCADANGLPASAAQGVRVFYDTFSGTGSMYTYDYGALSPLNLTLQSPAAMAQLQRGQRGDKHRDHARRRQPAGDQLLRPNQQ